MKIITNWTNIRLIKPHRNTRISNKTLAGHLKNAEKKNHANFHNKWRLTQAKIDRMKAHQLERAQSGTNAKWCGEFAQAISTAAHTKKPAEPNETPRTALHNTRPKYHRLAKPVISGWPRLNSTDLTKKKSNPIHSKKQNIKTYIVAYEPHPVKISTIRHTVPTARNAVPAKQHTANALQTNSTFVSAGALAGVKSTGRTTRGLSTTGWTALDTSINSGNMACKTSKHDMSNVICQIHSTPHMTAAVTQKLAYSNAELKATHLQATIIIPQRALLTAKKLTAKKRAQSWRIHAQRPTHKAIIAKIQDTI